ncbi:hypothetical protein [Acetobacter orleanensis]|uniref:Uncharacterized protein n=1 Tax=Acetobacter orleanensis TaxID=104099 RepID=A0A4Y3TS97_9PROT|nr:hypothetical protein [Acetobacter orleanensis]KXV62560.1 hypothetical protein AD949_10655 [Acetobacter orleanensis]PCD79993.1 hypothetical protein CO710_03815 [Acetobacter orleanensis]GAN68306.1 hypothetical protein Abol_015_145 [Acetobacter orleanensis JCM 7639]GBR27562.1 hypothetical protein AA0473_1472 [Acetobacter orleanensis NRIC 0473]GEB83880.1 hypothetical protein AOR01nite_23570 [Acetobacter orleanensis]
MQNVNQFERHRAALEQCVHNTVHDAEARQAMLSYIAAMGGAMHAEERIADAAMRTTHHAQRRGLLSRFVLDVRECAA